MAVLPLSVISDVCDQVAAWQEAFLSEASLKRYQRACSWTMSEVAKTACKGATDGIDSAFQDPTPWMRKAFTYTRALSKNLGEVEADVAVRPTQSIVMKYQMGDSPNVRRPADVGLAKDAILVPNWRNLSLTQGIHQNSYGNLPGGVAARLAREALGQLAKRRAPGRWGVYKGELDVGGSRVMGYIARPPRGYTPIGKGGREIVVNLGRPRALLVAIQSATYKPVMQPLYDRAMQAAVARIPALMEAELQDAIAYRAANGPLRRLGAAA